MFESVFKISCEIIRSGWAKDRASVDTFIVGLASSVRESNDYEEQVTLNLCLYLYLYLSWLIRLSFCCITVLTF